MGHDKNKSAAPPPGPGPLPYLENLVHPCVRLPFKITYIIIDQIYAHVA
jgi:hypothetical protein